MTLYALPRPARADSTFPWPLLLIAAPAAIAIWSGWVRLGALCGFGLVQPFPGIAAWHLDTAITLPVGIESYAAYALYTWLSGHARPATRKFARNSALGALALGCLGQVASHLLAVAGWAAAPWPVVVGVACLPVVTLSCAAALFHRVRADARPEVTDQGAPEVTPAPPVTPSRDSGDDSRGDKPPPRRPPARKPDPEGTKFARAAAVIRDNPGMTNPELAALAGCKVRTIQRARKGLPPR